MVSFKFVVAVSLVSLIAILNVAEVAGQTYQVYNKCNQPVTVKGNCSKTTLPPGSSCSCSGKGDIIFAAGLIVLLIVGAVIQLLLKVVAGAIGAIIYILGLVLGLLYCCIIPLIACITKCLGLIASK